MNDLNKISNNIDSSIEIEPFKKFHGWIDIRFEGLIFITLKVINYFII